MTKAKPVILRNAASETPSLWFYDEFGPDDWGYISANLVRQALTDLGPQKKIECHFNTPGGDVFEAQAIYNLLKNYGGKTMAIIDGMAISCGSWVPQACDSISMAENGLMMIHDPETMSYGNSAQLTKDAAMLDQVKNAILSCYTSRSSKTTSDQFAAAMSAETWYTAAEALNAGLIDSIDPNKTVTMCADPRRFRNAPSWFKEGQKAKQDWKTIADRRRQELLLLEAEV